MERAPTAATAYRPRRCRKVAVEDEELRVELGVGQHRLVQGFCQVWRQRNEFSNLLARAELSMVDRDCVIAGLPSKFAHSRVFGASSDRTS